MKKADKLANARSDIARLRKHIEDYRAEGNEHMVTFIQGKIWGMCEGLLHAGLVDTEGYINLAMRGDERRGPDE